MSVVVVGMTVPDRCYDCELYRFGCCEAKRIFFAPDYDTWTYNSRPNWCPLRPLPKEHGDLIDRDAFLKAEWDWCDAEDAIKAMPVIIEAEGENDAL